MRKVAVLSIVLLFIMGASFASAAPNVAGLTNRGSVLMFPLIDTQQGAETFLKISNDANKAVDLKCYWVRVTPQITVAPDCLATIGAEITKLPPLQSPTNFGLHLTRNQPVMFRASTGQSEAIDDIGVTVTPFGTGNIGYLACWAVNEDNEQINWNFLTGSAIVIGGTRAPTPIEYAAWTIGARSGSQGTKLGTPGTLLLDGKAYDSTPQYLIYNFPALGVLGPNIDLFLLQGSQNFKTMSKQHHVTKANVSLWNENEAPFSGVGTCAWCWKETLFDQMTNGTFLTAAGLGTSVGRMRIQGVASSGCLPDLTEFQAERCFTSGTTFETYSTGLLAVAITQFGGGATAVLPVQTGGQILTDKLTFDPTQP